ncbi:hypothetical protein N9N32_00490 [Alphaproteobacteria bacterium]|nr:hypothetical protein [Alphaproteobacteria bacterium]
MPLQTSGAISLNDIHIEAGGTTGTAVTANDSDVRGLISKASGAQMSFSEWYGASAGETLTSERIEYTNGNNSYFITYGYTDSGTNGTGVYSHSVSTYSGILYFAFANNQGSLTSSSIPGNWSLRNLYIGGNPSFYVVNLFADKTSGSIANSGWTSMTLSTGGTNYSFNRSSANSFSNLSGNTGSYPSGQSFDWGGDARWQWQFSSNSLYTAASAAGASGSVNFSISFT